jgi:hypothetical protein
MVESVRAKPMDPLHSQLFEETKAANELGFAEMRRQLAEMDRLLAIAHKQVASWTV